MNEQPPFIVLSLPRSRSAWMSAFLSYGGLRCGHDIAVECASIADFKAALDDLRGTCETGAAIAWRLLRQEYPQAKLVVVQRPVGEVMDSFARMRLFPSDTLADLTNEMLRRALFLNELSRQPNVLFLPFRAIDEEAGCAMLFEHCLGIPHDHEWWLCLRDLNIQIDFPARLKRLARNAAHLARLKAEVVERLRVAA